MDIFTTESVVNQNYSAGLVGLLSHLDDGTLIGAFSGAVIFVLSSEDYRLLYRIILGIVSFIGGVLSATFFTEVVMSVLPGNIVMPLPLGSLFSSAGIVRILMYFSRNSSSVMAKVMEKKE